jgi:pimeloyl-ACP methyl ester carboxylesterase
MSDAKDVVFLIRGLTREKRHWEGFDKKLQNTLHEKKVVCLDLPGFGDKFNEKSPLTINGIAEKVLKSKEYNSFKDYKKTLVGLSLGGMVCLEMAFKKPEDFSRLVIINSSQRFKTPFYKRINFFKLPRLFFLFLFKATYMRERLILRLTTNTKFNPDIPKKWSDFYNEKPLKRRSALYQTLAGGSFSLRRKCSVLKTLKGYVLVAKKDRLVNPYSSEIIARVLNWPIESHPSAGHDLPYDDPDWVVSKIKSFLDV